MKMVTEHFYTSINKNGKEYCVEENLYKCKKSCYKKFAEHTTTLVDINHKIHEVTHIGYKKSDVLEKKDGQWWSKCKRCGFTCKDNTVGSETEDHLLK